eukprot:scaffold64_cov338-Pavlova_lutheri.AAC.82
MQCKVCGILISDTIFSECLRFWACPVRCSTHCYKSEPSIVKSTARAWLLVFLLIRAGLLIWQSSLLRRVLLSSVANAGIAPSLLVEHFQYDCTSGRRMKTALELWTIR